MLMQYLIIPSKNRQALQPAYTSFNMLQLSFLYSGLLSFHEVRNLVYGAFQSSKFVKDDI
jgi:hypothetical protein